MNSTTIKICPKGFGFIQVFLILIVISALAVGFRIYKNSEKKAEIARQETLKKQETAAELARQEALKKQEEAHKVELAMRIAEQNIRVKSILNKWDDALKLASMTSRVALAQPLSQMQAVRREMDELKLNDCIDGATRKIVSGMNDAIFAFEMFVRFSNNTVASASTEQSLSSSGEKINSGKQALSHCAMNK